MPADLSTWLAKIPLSDTPGFLRLPRTSMVRRTHGGDVLVAKVAHI